MTKYWPEGPYKGYYDKERINGINDIVKRSKYPVFSSSKDVWLPDGREYGMTYDNARGGYRCEFGHLEALTTPYGYYGYYCLNIVEKGAEVPPEILDNEPWVPAEAVIDFEERTATIVAGETNIVFSAVEIGSKPDEILVAINKHLKEQRAHVWCWQIVPKPFHGISRHVYPDGKVPVVMNEHTRAYVTGYALRPLNSYQNLLVYVGMVAHKTSVESLWASLVQVTKGQNARIWMDVGNGNAPMVPDGAIKLVTHPLQKFAQLSANIVVERALPGRWHGNDQDAYVLWMEEEPTQADIIEKFTHRMQECVAFPILDEWGKVLYGLGKNMNYISELKVGGDCKYGISINLNVDWVGLTNGLLQERTIVIGG